MKQTTAVLLICLISVLSQTASAAGSSMSAGPSVYFEETFFPVYVKKNDGSTSQQVGTESGLGFDLRSTLGAVFWQNVFFGLSYNYYNVNTSRPMTNDYEGLKTTTTKSEFGPTVGYMTSNWRFLLTYLLSAAKTYHEVYTLQGTGSVDTDNNYKYSSGSGFQLEVAYAFELGAGFALGPTLVYREVTYKKEGIDSLSSSTAAASTVSNAVDANLQPMITLSYQY